MQSWRTASGCLSAFGEISDSTRCRQEVVERFKNTLEIVTFAIYTNYTAREVGCGQFRGDRCLPERHRVVKFIAGGALYGAATRNYEEEILIWGVNPVFCLDRASKNESGPIQSE